MGKKIIDVVIFLEYEPLDPFEEQLSQDGVV